jgi:hypothetical protein
VTGQLATAGRTANARWVCVVTLEASAGGQRARWASESSTEAPIPTDVRILVRRNARLARIGRGTGA